MRLKKRDQPNTEGIKISNVKSRGACFTENNLEFTKSPRLLCGKTIRKLHLQLSFQFKFSNNRTINLTPEPLTLKKVFKTYCLYWTPLLLLDLTHFNETPFAKILHAVFEKFIFGQTAFLEYHWLVIEYCFENFNCNHLTTHCRSKYFLQKRLINGPYLSTGVLTHLGTMPFFFFPAVVSTKILFKVPQWLRKTM